MCLVGTRHLAMDGCKTNSAVLCHGRAHVGTGHRGTTGTRRPPRDVRLVAGRGGTPHHFRQSAVVLRGEDPVAGESCVCVSPLGGDGKFNLVVGAADGRRGGRRRTLDAAAAAVGAGRSLWVWVFRDGTAAGVGILRRVLFSLFVCGGPLSVSREPGTNRVCGQRDHLRFWTRQVVGGSC